MGKSSKDKRDIHYRLAKEQNWRARSAFKLIQLDEEYDLFSYDKPEECTRVVDLCAAPGSWSQVLSRILVKGESFGRRAWAESERGKPGIFGTRDVDEKTNLGLHDEDKDDGDDGQVVSKGRERDDSEAESAAVATFTTAHTKLHHEGKPDLKPRKDVKIVSIDLQPIATLEGITTLKADITHPSTLPRLLAALSSPSAPAGTEYNPLVDLVLSDGAPDVTGLHDLDIYIQSRLLTSALTLTMNILRPGGKFVAKIFTGYGGAGRTGVEDLLETQLGLVFERVRFVKPRSSRESSREGFVIAEGFMPVPGWTPKLGGDDDNNDSDNDRETVVSDVNGKGNGNGKERMSEEERMARKWIKPLLEVGDLSAWDD